ncbi:hypothetical protein JNUCC74_02775 [Cerasibacillus sp. JNUCC 74]|jgi:hypothetical protein|nr:hypothetical protein [Virgibacillus proomii]
MSAVKSGVLFASSLFICTGIGFLFDEIEIGGTIGFGMGIISIIVYRKNN